MWYVIHNDELYHHGILGQKWGKRNGPPYPLGAGDHSASEKKAGWRKSIDKGSGDSYNKKRNAKDKNGSSEGKGRHGLTDGQKRAIKIGIAAAAAGLAVYGGYKLYQSGKLNPVIAKFAKDGETLAGELPGADNIVSFTNGSQSPADGLKRLAKPESLGDTIKNTNPNNGNPLYANNCSYCGIAAILRQKGFDVTAKDTGRKMMELLGVVEECFEEGSYQKREHFPRSTLAELTASPDNAARKLTGWFGQNASGCISVGWEKGGGHVFNWDIKDGTVTFYDPQKQQVDSVVRDYWGFMSKERDIQVVRLDEAIFKKDKITSVVN